MLWYAFIRVATGGVESTAEEVAGIKEVHTEEKLWQYRNRRLQPPA